MKYEYRVLIPPPYGDDPYEEVLEELSMMGQEGWEFVSSVVHHGTAKHHDREMWIYKRKII